METNIATRDAVQATWAAVAEARDAGAARAALDELRAEFRAELDARDGELNALRAELDNLRRSDQNMVAGLNQRLYAAVGSLRTELSDLRLGLADKQEAGHDLRERLDALERELAEVVAAGRETALRHARVDLFLDAARTGADPVDAVPARDDFLELAVAGLLDGPVERVRERRREHLPLIRAARDAGANGPVFDMAPGRGEWLELLRSAGVPVLASTDNRSVAAHCAGAGIDLGDRPAAEALAACPRRSLGAVTAFRYAERQDPHAVAAFFEAAALALQPGGVLVVDTPKPDAAEVRVDPLLRRPLHPAFARFLAESAGFARVEVVDAPATADGAAQYSLRAWM
ncbi:hypothetical protein ACFQV2_39165 [Actinokineospora soli]|uniref:Methyltransferase domain-containing protein n=1 Tax=Actinokineospora soli TaxID=1048753 RepID=A0ABW2TX31_9PSEU